MALFCWLAAIHTLAAVQRADVVELANGDREIRKLDRGKLTLKTDGIGTLSIEWDDVDRVTSAASYDVELPSGQRLFGSQERGDAGSVGIVTATGRERLPLGGIVRLTPLGETFCRPAGEGDQSVAEALPGVKFEWFKSNVRHTRVVVLNRCSPSVLRKTQLAYLANSDDRTATTEQRMARAPRMPITLRPVSVEEEGGAGGIPG